MLERLQKIISAAGITSRRASEELIVNGQVTVNGVVVTELGTKADPSVDTITVNGKSLRVSEERLYILLNKPTGYITALKDDRGRRLVTDLLKDVPERVYPVGRLDYNTEGLLLLTNDGEWANRLMHPRHEVEKEYHVRVRGKVVDQQLKRMADGVELEDGKTAPAVAQLIKSGEQNDWISVTIHEGRNRQVRRMCEAVSLSVVRLKRIRYGSLSLGTLRDGQFRYLTEAEVNALAGTESNAVPVNGIKIREERSHEKPEQKRIQQSPRSTTPLSGKTAENRGKGGKGQDRKPFTPKTDDGRRIPKKPC